jgi:hypothetical protein
LRSDDARFFVALRVFIVLTVRWLRGESGLAEERLSKDKGVPPWIVGSSSVFWPLRSYCLERKALTRYSPLGFRPSLQRVGIVLHSGAAKME